MSLDSVDLFWLPLGAGDVVVQHSGRWFEALDALIANGTIFIARRWRCIGTVSVS
jgi:hypothetical protein